MRLSDAVKDLMNKMGKLEGEITKELVVELKRNSPVDTGFLRASWIMTPSANGITTVMNGAEYSAFVEFGTDRQRAQKFTYHTIKYRTDAVLQRAAINIHSATGGSILERLLGK